MCLLHWIHDQLSSLQQVVMSYHFNEFSVAHPFPSGFCVCVCVHTLWTISIYWNLHLYVCGICQNCGRPLAQEAGQKCQEISTPGAASASLSHVPGPLCLFLNQFPNKLLYWSPCLKVCFWGNPHQDPAYLVFCHQLWKHLFLRDCQESRFNTPAPSLLRWDKSETLVLYCFPKFLSGIQFQLSTMVICVMTHAY